MAQFITSKTIICQKSAKMQLSTESGSIQSAARWLPKNETLADDLSSFYFVKRRLKHICEYFKNLGMKILSFDKELLNTQWGLPYY